MIHSKDIWDIIQTKMPRGRWVSLQEIYRIVKQFGNLDPEDFKPAFRTSNAPKWQRNVRNVLQHRKNEEIKWDRDRKGMYLLPQTL